MSNVLYIIEKINSGERELRVRLIYSDMVKKKKKIVHASPLRVIQREGICFPDFKCCKQMIQFQVPDEYARSRTVKNENSVS